MPTPLYGNQSTTTLYSPQNVSSGGSTTSTILAYRVKDIILDDTHKDFKKYGEWNGIGTVFIDSTKNRYSLLVFTEYTHLIKLSNNQEINLPLNLF